MLSSTIAPVETVSALCLRQAAGDLTKQAVATALARMTRERARWELIGLTSLVLSRAEELVQAHTLRPLDAVHLASALVFQADTGYRVPFVTADARQRQAAQRANLDVVWVG